MADKKENIVTNDSKAYGYNYASLSDIAKQGFKIPKMKSGTDGEREYVYYFDTDLNEWIRGAEIKIPEMKGSNEAQRYGSGLTYARRYTCHLALCLACDDDKEVETKKPSGLFDENMNLGDLARQFNELYSNEERERILAGLNVTRAEDIGLVNLQKYVNFKKYGGKQTSK